MEFRTKLNISPSPAPFQHDHRLLLIGSCFSDSIGEQLELDGFKALVNPFGVLYNPLSISKNLRLLLHSEPHSADEIRQHSGTFYHVDYHTAFSGDSREQVLHSINSQLESSRQFIQPLDYLIITFGSAYAYYYQQEMEPVANCHKIPDKEFTVKLLSVDEIVKEYQVLLEEYRKRFPNIRIIFTLSPVRHWKYGAEGNQRSKAILLLAIHELVSQSQNLVSYFPSYEIMMDELRDYRFYADDMLHIGNKAVAYIYEQFKATWMQAQSAGLANEVRKLHQAKFHRIMHPGSVSHRQFINQQIEKLNLLQANHPGLDLQNLSKYFENQLQEISKLA